MSPYCPTCLGVSNENEVRCPLDSQFLRQRRCVECEGELFPREVYCARCGALNRGPEEVLLIPPAAPPARQLGSIFLDFLSIAILVIVLIGEWSPVLCVLLFPLFFVFYRTLGRSGGRQSFGQSVFGIATISPQAGPVTFFEGLRRSLWEVAKAPLLMRARTEAELELRTGTLEVTLV